MLASLFLFSFILVLVIIDCNLLPCSWLSWVICCFQTSKLFKVLEAWAKNSLIPEFGLEASAEFLAVCMWEDLKARKEFLIQNSKMSLGHHDPNWKPMPNTVCNGQKCSLSDTVLIYTGRNHGSLIQHQLGMEEPWFNYQYLQFKKEPDRKWCEGLFLKSWRVTDRIIRQYWIW